MPTDADRFRTKAATAASETERAAWLAAANAAGERDRLVDAYIHEQRWPECPHSIRFQAILNMGQYAWCSSKAEAVAAVRRAAGLDAGGGSDG